MTCKVEQLYYPILVQLYDFKLNYRVKAFAMYNPHFTCDDPSLLYITYTCGH